MAVVEFVVCTCALLAVSVRLSSQSASLAVMAMFSPCWRGPWVLTMKPSDGIWKHISNRLVKIKIQQLMKKPYKPNHAVDKGVAQQLRIKYIMK